jgi:hypothetical protein
MEKIKIDIGSGRSKLDGYITLDKEPEVNADITFDFENDFIGILKYNDKFISEVDEIRAYHILEHFRPENKVMIMKRFYDLLKEEGILDIAVPKFPSPASIQDPTHLSFWNKESFWYFTKGNNFGEAFVKRCPESPLFEFVEDDDSKDWEYKIKLRK